MYGEAHQGYISLHFICNCNPIHWKGFGVDFGPRMKNPRMVLV